MRYYEYMLQKGREMDKSKEFRTRDRTEDVCSGYTEELDPNKGQCAGYGVSVNFLDGVLYGNVEVVFDDTFGEPLNYTEGDVGYVETTPDSRKTDSVEHPNHYNQSGIECIEAIRASLGDEFGAYCKGNVMKYLWRYKYKNGLEDLQKAKQYLEWLIETEEEKGA